MPYFNKINTLEELKASWRRLAMENHPDAGGDLEAMKQINIEYEARFNVLKRSHNAANPQDPIREYADAVASEFYTANGWKGSNYRISLTTTEIAKIIRDYVKAQYPAWRFSVTSSYFSGGSSIAVAVTEAPYDVFDREGIAEKAALEIACYGNDAWGHDQYQAIGRIINRERVYLQMHSVSERDAGYLVPEAYRVMQDVYDFMESYNRRDCDGQIDYFDVNFWTSFDIGKGPKGFQVVERPGKKRSIERVA